MNPSADPLLRFRPEFPILETSTNRPDVGIRLSPHFHTDDAELDSAFAAIDEILATGAWSRWQGHPSLVT